MLHFFPWALFAFCAGNSMASSTSTAPLISSRKDDVQLLHPHIITIERLEHLLRRAGEIFRPDFNVMPPTTPQPTHSPQLQMQPPVNQPYNFYMPLFDYHFDTKLDAKSRKMEKFLPPPVPQQLQYDYYAAKPKKSPKKFNAATKHINVKWLESYEQANGGQLPKAMYLEQDERNRINFDDTFFAVDMQVKIPDNQPHKEPKHPEVQDLLKHSEEMSQEEEDLMAAPAQFQPQFSYVHNRTPKSST